MEDYERNCYIFIQRLTEELAQDYDIQYENMETFVRWNLPEEIALEWIDAEGMIDILECGKCIPKETADMLKGIITEFVLAFEIPNNPVWTHEAMKTGSFWGRQRSNARKLLDKLQE